MAQTPRWQGHKLPPQIHPLDGYGTSIIAAIAPYPLIVDKPLKYFPQVGAYHMDRKPAH